MVATISKSLIESWINLEYQVESDYMKLQGTP